MHTKYSFKAEETEKEEELQQYKSHTHMLINYPSKNIHFIQTGHHN